jgi:hypothetical protein
MTEFGAKVFKFCSETHCLAGIWPRRQKVGLVAFPNRASGVLLQALKGGQPEYWKSSFALHPSNPALSTGILK